MKSGVDDELPLFADAQPAAPDAKCGACGRREKACKEPGGEDCRAHVEFLARAREKFLAVDWNPD